MFYVFFFSFRGDCRAPRVVGDWCLFPFCVWSSVPVFLLVGVYLVLYVGATVPIVPPYD